MPRNRIQIKRVQQVVSTYRRKTACVNEIFKTQVHPALCLLNTRQPCACVGAGPLRIVPSQLNRCAGDLISLPAELRAKVANRAELDGRQDGGLVPRRTRINNTAIWGRCPCTDVAWEPFFGEPHEPGWRNRQKSSHDRHWPCARGEHITGLPDDRNPLATAVCSQCVETERIPSPRRVSWPRENAPLLW